MTMIVAPLCAPGPQPNMCRHPSCLREVLPPGRADFALHPFLEHSMGFRFIGCEVPTLNCAERYAEIKPIFASSAGKVGEDYCITRSGCNLGPFKPMGESMGFTTAHEEAHNISG